RASGGLVTSLDASIARFRSMKMQMKFGSWWLINIIGSLRFIILHWSGYSILLEFPVPMLISSVEHGRVVRRFLTKRLSVPTSSGTGWSNYSRGLAIFTDWGSPIGT